VDQQTTLEIYIDMCRMREFELLIGAGVASGEIHGEMHLGVGQEIVAAVLGRHLRPGDAVVSTHRPHLHGLACGVDPVAMLAEIFERDGLNHGKGGHMHLFDPASNFMCTGIVGAAAPLAAGYALKQRVEGNGSISVAVAGDGAVNQGAVAETMNLAALRSLPLLFLVEDNGYGISVPAAKSTAGKVRDRAEAMGIPVREASGISVDDVDDAIGQSVRSVRESAGPAMAIVRVYRFRGHYEGDADLYRDPGEKNLAMGPGQDPLLVLRADILAVKMLSEAALAELEQAARGQARAWHDRARQVAMPARSSAHTGVFADE
jgi:acetoin:2,6-dichlorophenolindophenol oxidoreductase subunit alpha